MSAKLAVFTEYVGARSQTFIKRQIQGLYPGRTVVVTDRDVLGKGATWIPKCPEFCTARESGQFFLEGLLPKQVKAAISRVSLRKFLKAHHVEVILGQFLHDSWPYLHFAKKNGIRFYAHAHGYDLSQKYKEDVWRERYADYALADGVIVVNQVMRQRLLSVGVPDEKIHIVPYGVDVLNEPIDRTGGEYIRCLAVGRMIPKKAPLKLLEAFRQAASENSRLILDFVGEGPLLPDVTDFIGLHKLQERVTLHGGQPNDYVMRLMQQADIFLQHSVVDPETGDEEGLPVVILEAMANALPVISTRHAGIPEAVIHEDCGLLVEEGDVDGMADYIASLSCAPLERASMGRRGWKRAKEKYSWEVERTSLMEILNL